MQPLLKNTLLVGILITLLSPAQSQTVTLDYFFNREYLKNTTGLAKRFHYTWEDTTYSGFSVLGNIFRKNNIKTKSLEAAPTKSNLKSTDIYIIVDPDNKKETEHPNYIQRKQVKVIAKWVKAGGVLVLMGNDSTNVNLPDLNKLSEVFGIHFNNDKRNQITKNQFDMAAFILSATNEIFKTAKKIYMRDICTLTLNKQAKPVLKEGEDIIMGTARYGTGTVFAVGDPWLYNEYCNGRLPAGFHNDRAADDLIKWIKNKIPQNVIYKKHH